MDLDNDYEHLPTNKFSIHMTAGAIAGVMEHCVMYPLDSVKTRMQSLSPQYNNRGVLQVLNVMIKQEGLLRPVRGMGAVVAGAGPAHALYFSCYEHLKHKIQSKTSQPFYVVAGLAGVVATFVHDGVMTPAEVVKQRLQMQDSPYRSIMDCVRKTYGTEGLRAFYRSYTTQLTMNVPFQSIHFIMYELCQNLTNHERKYNPAAHMTSGAVAGAVAAAVTTPLDVVKTLLNTQQTRVIGMVSAFKMVYRLGGPSGYFKGLQARILYQMPSTAICWSMYELFKYLLTSRVPACTDVVVADRELAPKLRPGILLVVPQVNLEPGKATDETYRDDWSASIPDTVKFGTEKRTIEKEWCSPVVPGSIGALSFNTIHRDGPSHDTRSEMLDITHS